MKKIKKATTADGVLVASSLEKYAYETLQKEEIPFHYNSVVFRLQPRLTYPNICLEKKGKKKGLLEANLINPITYKPDFVDPKGNWIIETKGYATPQFTLRWKMFKAMLISNKSTPMLFMPTSNKEVDECIQIIKNNQNDNL